MVIIQRKDFDFLLSALQKRDYAIMGPSVRDGAIMYDEIRSVSDLPVGWTDEHEKSRYRLKRRADAALFGYTVGPQSWKKFLFPPLAKILTVVKRGKAMEIKLDGSKEIPPRYAFFGVRPCELNAITIQDKVFNNDRFSDPSYCARRKNVFIVAVNCTESGGTCFCGSMNTGPEVKGGYDIALTEVVKESVHYFTAEAGSDKGSEVLNDVPHKNAETSEVEAAQELVNATRTNMGRTMDTDGLKELLVDNLESAHWDDVARRCLMCANCTLVCPTCFCSTVDDVTDLSGEHAERWRRWDSCFTMDFAKVTGGNFRLSPRARYRQWMTHKFSTWVDQFGTLGCVGCGRCITWCPVGIDVTAEVQAIRNNSVRSDA
ncbi:MAG: 4Fe-4S dicluster domain-containing protein [Bacteroidota bacterium]